MFDFLKKPLAELFIARPDEASLLLVWRYPDRNIPFGAKLTVRQDEQVLFFKEGKLIGILGPGTYSLSTSVIPFLDQLIVSPLTGGNHYLTELFFVRQTEVSLTLGPCVLGTFQDISSRLLVNLIYEANVTVRVRNPVELLTELVGMRNDVSDWVAAFLTARFSSFLAQFAGRVLMAEPVVQLISNQYSEQVGQSILRQAQEECVKTGIELSRILSLGIRLDEDSARSLRTYSEKMADLGVQREQADLGAQQGFAAYNLVKGQRALLEGMATGAATHGLPPLSPSIGLPGTSLPIRSAIEPAASRFDATPRIGAVAGVNRYYLQTPSGIEGPYPVKQLVLRIESLHQTVESSLVRIHGTAEWAIASDQAEIAAEFTKRHPQTTSVTQALPVAQRSNLIDLFERALRAIQTAAQTSPELIDSLAQLAVDAGLAPSQIVAHNYVTTRLMALRSENRPGPPALPPPLDETEEPSFVYDNGIERIEGLSAESVAARVNAVPDGVHRVWRPGMPKWLKASDVQEIKRLLE